MQNVRTFYIKEGEEYIELIKLLKIVNIAQSGALAQILVTEQKVKRNGETELRKRAKIRRGETIEALGQKIEVL